MTPLRLVLGAGLALLLASPPTVAGSAVAGASAAGGTTVTLSCALPARGAPGGKPVARIFQIGSGAFREWNAVTHEYGANLCQAYNCVASPDRLEGSISSASVTYVVGIQPGSAQGYWRVTGAMSPGQGVCEVIPPRVGRRP